MTRKVGSRFTDGHQFMLTDHDVLKRDPPLRERAQVGPYNATVELVPLVGQLHRYRDKYDVCARWQHPQNGSVSTSRHVTGLLEASRYYHELLDALRYPGPNDELLNRAIGA